MISEGEPRGSTFVSIFATKGPKRCFYLGVPNVPKKLVIGPINVALSAKKKKEKEKKKGVSTPKN
jgi:hypothetical protein